MTQENKQLLLKDLCARLPYYVMVEYEGKEWLVTGYGHGRVSLLPSIFSSGSGPCPLVEEVRSYLRPMSSITEEEYKEYSKLWDLQDEFPTDADIRFKIDVFDWLNAHHFDYRGLIPMGLALEAPKGMYKTE